MVSEVTSLCDSATLRLIALLYFAVSSDEHCSNERRLGKSSSSLSDQEGNFFFRSCLACICRMTNCLSILSGNFDNANLLMSSFRCSSIYFRVETSIVYSLFKSENLRISESEKFFLNILNFSDFQISTTLFRFSFSMSRTILLLLKLLLLQCNKLQFHSF